MPKYFDTITEATDLNYKTGTSLAVSPEFAILSSTIISQCTFLQNLIQQIIYTSHAAELVGAKRTLKDFPNPRSRFDFLCTFPYSEHDPTVAKVFDFARSIFKEVYEFRNVLSHEIWSSSDTWKDMVLFSTLDEQSRLLMASGRLWHDDAATPQQIFDASIRFIRSVKVVSVDHLKAAIEDANLCSWALMNINNILNEDDPQRREVVRQAFLVFRGTSHLFDPIARALDVVDYMASKEKKIG